MTIVLRTMLVFITLFGVVCTSLAQGKVYCTTDSGHAAIEPEHGPGNCQEAQRELPQTPAGESEPCKDVSLPRADIVSHDSTLKLPPLQLVHLAYTALAVGTDSLFYMQQPRVRGDADMLPCAMQGELARLSCIVLLI